MRLIDADALMKKWLDQPDPPFKCDSEVALMEKLCSDWIDLIKDAPTIEPEQRTGKWIAEEEYGDLWVCDQCGEPCATYVMNKPRDRFCKWCGADMRGEEDG